MQAKNKKNLEGQEKPPRKGKKPGPKLKIGPKEEAEIIAVLTVGASLKDAARYIGVNYTTLRNRRRADQEFSHRLDQAVAKGKVFHMNKISKAPAWQASAFMLERKWPDEFARRERHEHTGKNGGPIRSKTTVDFSQFSDEELLKFERAASRRETGIGEPSRN